LVLAGTVLAQKPYFVYLQTENQAPFFVQFNKKNYSSSSAGHVILPSLTNGDYTIQIGFPGQNATQEYTFTINNEDHGYLVKKFEDDFGILNLQNSTVQLSGSAKKAIAEEERKKAVALQEAQRQEEARLATETAELEKRRLEEEKRITEEKAAVEKANADKLAGDKAGGEKELEEAKTKANAENAAIEKANLERANTEKIALEKAAKEKADAEKALTAASATEIEKAGVAKTESAVSKSSTASDVGGGRVVVTETAAPAKLTPAEIAKLQEEARRIDAKGKRDSVLKAQKTVPATSSNPAFLDIDFTMPADSTEAEPEKIVVVPEIKQVIADSVPAKIEAVVETKEVAKKAENVTGIELVKEEPVAVAVVTEKPTVGLGTDSLKASDSIQAMPAKNPNCHAEATDADIELIAMLMKGEKQSEDALDIARKSMKVKCVSTSQIRKLALLFETQEDRYILLDMAHRYTSDKHKYAQLSDLLTDTYFLNRFKAMIQ
jgi:hypothetical protein